MPRIYVEYDQLKAVGDSCKRVSSSVSGISSSIRNTIWGLDWDVRFKDDINKSANHIRSKLREYSSVLRSYRNFLELASEMYKRLDENKGSSFGDYFKEDFDAIKLFKGITPIATVYDLYKHFTDFDNGADFLKGMNDSASDIYDFVKSILDYKKIGPAMNARHPHANWENWWKKTMGLKWSSKHDYLSENKNPFAAFRANLSNKNSPFNIKNALSKKYREFTGAEGRKECFAAWTGVILSFATNYIANKDEQKESGGSMSDERVLAEAATETVVDSAIKGGTKLLVGAAIAAVAPAAATPVVVAAATYAATTLLDVGCKKLTGKSTTEWVSDKIVDIGEDMGLGDKARHVKKSVVKWWNSTFGRK